MAITYFEKERIFKLDTPASSYVIGIVDKENFVGHSIFSGIFFIVAHCKHVKSAKCFRRIFSGIAHQLLDLCCSVDSL